MLKRFISLVLITVMLFTNGLMDVAYAFTDAAAVQKSNEKWQEIIDTDLTNDTLSETEDSELSTESNDEDIIDGNTGEAQTDKIVGIEQIKPDIDSADKDRIALEIIDKMAIIDEEYEGDRFIITYTVETSLLSNAELFQNSDEEINTSLNKEAASSTETGVPEETPVNPGDEEVIDEGFNEGADEDEDLNTDPNEESETLAEEILETEPDGEDNTETDGFNEALRDVGEFSLAAGFVGVGMSENTGKLDVPETKTDDTKQLTEEVSERKTEGLKTTDKPAISDTVKGINKLSKEARLELFTEAKAESYEIAKSSVMRSRGGIISIKTLSNEDVSTNEIDFTAEALNGKMLVETSEVMTAKEVADSFAAVEGVTIYIQPDYVVSVSSEFEAYPEKIAADYDALEIIKEPLVGVEFAENEELPNRLGINSASSTDRISKVYSHEGDIEPETDDEYQIDIGLSKALSIAKGEGVLVAVLDTGIDANHEALANSIFINPNENNNNLDNDENGYIGDVSGWDFVNKTNLVNNPENMLDQWHGTHIAGLIAGAESSEAAGTAPNAKILPLKIFENGVAYTSDILEAIAYAESMGAKIVNCSWGTPNENLALKEAMLNSDMLFVCAAGNRLTNNDNSPVYPASYDLPNVISVASVDSNGKLSRFSNFGPGSVDVSAPGNDINVITIENSFVKNSGTSLSAAIVSGEAALVLSVNDELSASQIRDIIINSSVTVSGLTDKIKDGKLVNVYEAVANPDIANTDYLDIPDSPIEEGPVALDPGSEEYELFGADGFVTMKAPMPTAREGLQAEAVNGKIYAIGGQYNTTYYNKVEAYNPETDKWETKASMSSARSYFASAVVSGKIYVFGGKSSSSATLATVEMYDPVANTWTSKGSMPVALSSLSAAAYNGKIYLSGGLNSAGTAYTNVVYEYTPNSGNGTFASFATLSSPRGDHGSFVYGGKLHIEGGLSAYTSTTFYNANEETVNLSTKAVTQSGVSRQSGANGISMAIDNRYIGIDGSERKYIGYSNNIFQCDLLNSNHYSFVRQSQMANPRGSVGVTYLDGQVYIIGGRNENSLFNTVEVLESGFAQKGNMPKKLIDFVTVELDGKVYVLGGDEYVNGNYVPSKGAYVYNPATNAWASIPDMPSYLYNFTAAGMYGKIYIFGASVSDAAGNYLGSTYQITEYDPVYNTWSILAKGPTVYRNATVLNGLAYLNSGTSFATYNPLTNSFATKASTPAAAYLGGLHAKGDKVFLFGPSVCHIYDPATNKWRSQSFSTPFGGYIARVYDSIFGIQTPIDTLSYVFKYDEVGNTSSYYSSFSYVGNTFHNICALNNKVLIFVGTNNYAEKIVEYSPMVDSWISKAAAPSATVYSGGAVLGSKVYLAGGYGVLQSGGAIAYQKFLKEYNTLTDTWTAKADMPTVRSKFGMAEAGGKLYAIGGEINTSGGSTNLVHEYNPSANTWAAKANYPYSLHSMSAVSYDGQVYVFGGTNGSSVYNYVYAYNPSTNTWTQKTNMPTARFGTNAVVNNGIIYVMGGFTSTSTTASAITTVQAYNPATNTWTTKTAMPEGRAYFGAASERNIFAVAGTNGSSEAASVYEYDPVLDKWFNWYQAYNSLKGLYLAQVNGGLYAFCGQGASGVFSSTRYAAISGLNAEYIHFGSGEINPSGNLSRNYVDMAYNTPGFNVQVSRSYNSRDPRSKNQIMGRGWTFGFQSNIDTSGNYTTISLPNGAVINFQNSGGIYTAYDSRSTLVKSGTRHILTTADQYVYEFNASGYMDKMVDPNGNTLTITVDSAGKPTLVKDQKGRNLTIGYNTNSLISSVTDPTGRVVSYTYDTSLRLKTVTDPSGNVTTYDYDSDGYLSAIKDNSNNTVESFTHEKPENETMKKLKTSRDIHGNTRNYVYNYIEGTVTVTDSQNRVNTTYYDNSLYEVSNIDPEGYETRTIYNLDNGLNRYGEPSVVTDMYGNSTYYDRDKNGNITRVVNPDMSNREYTYNNKNKLLSQKDESGNMTYYEYDSTGINMVTSAARLIGTGTYTAATRNNFAVTTYTYGTANGVYGLMLTKTNPEGHTTNYSYDTNGYLASETSPLGKVTSYINNTLGWRTKETDPNGNVTSFYYDKNGRILKKVYADGGTERYVYDFRGNVLRKTTLAGYSASSDSAVFTSENIASSVGNYTGGNCYTYSYDGFGRLLTSTNPNGHAISYTYDVYSNVLTKTMPNGAVYSYTYDKINRLLLTYFKENSGAAAQLLSERDYIIVNNNTIPAVLERTFFNAQDFNETITFYDYAGREIEVINTTDDSSVMYDYYPTGNLYRITDAMGYKTYFGYDQRGRKIEEYKQIDTSTYRYTAYEYNKNDKLTKETAYVNAVSLNSPSGPSLVTNYVYDNDGRLIESNDNSGKQKWFAYDNVGNKITETVKMDSSKNKVTRFEYNNMNRVSKIIMEADRSDIYGQGGTGTLNIETTSIYDLNGNLTHYTDELGNQTVYTYDPMGQILTTSYQVINENGSAVTATASKTYDSMGNVKTSTDPKGNTTTYVYNGMNLLTGTIDALNNRDLTEYDLAGRVTAQVTRQNYTGGSASSMNRTVFAYDSKGNLLSRANIYNDYWSNSSKTVYTERNTYNLNNNLITQKDADGNTTVMTYDGLGRTLTVRDPETASRGLSYTVKYEYDALGRVKRQLNANNVPTVFTYDLAGNLTSATVDGTVTSSSTYDLLGNALSTTDPMGQTVTYEYNSLGLLKSVTYPGDSNIGQYTKNYLYDVKLNTAQEYDSSNKETTTTYDYQNKPLTVTVKQKNAAAGITTSYAYDINGNVIYLTDPNGNVTTNTYDGLNRQVSKSITVGTSTQTDTIEYDKDGRITKQTNYLGNSTVSRYDALGRLSEVIDPLNVTVQKLVYDDMGRQISSTDAVSNVITYAYDKNSRLLSTATTISGTLNKTVSQTYDNVGNTATKKDGRGNVTTYTYDRLNRLTKITNPDNSTVSYTYNLNSQVTSQTDGKGNAETFAYNIRGLQSKITDGAGLESTLKYNPNGSLNEKTDRNGVKTSYTYDVYGRLTQEDAGGDIISYQYDSNGNLLKMTDSTGETIRTYDSLNRVLTKTVPEFGTTTFTYDITAGLTSGYVAESTLTPDGSTTQNIYDKALRLYQVKDGNTVSATYAYYANGARQSVTYPGNITEEYTYYGDLSLKTLTNKKNGIILEAFNYAYDGNGNMLTKLDGKGTTTYTYNSMNQLLTVAEATGRSISYTYDAAGNRLTETVTENGVTTVTTAEYNAQNRLVSTSETKLGEMLVTNYTYDNNGNNTKRMDYARYSVVQGQAPQLIELLAESSNGETGIYVYDTRNRLVRATDGNETVINTYNGQGLRVSKAANSKTIHFLYNGDKVILEKNAATGGYTKNVYGLNQISREDSSGKMYYLYNGHGDVTQLINSGGIVVVSYYYDAFGNILEETGSANNPYKYSGYYYDTEVSLYYLKSRFYNPKTARFMQEDTYRGNPAAVLSLNRYTYCQNNPIIYHDPSGYAATNVDYTSVRSVNENLGNTVSWSAGTGNKDSTITIGFNGTNASAVLKEGKDFYIDAGGTARYINNSNPDDVPIIIRDKGNGSSSGSSSKGDGYDYDDYDYSSGSYYVAPKPVEEPKSNALVLDFGVGTKQNPQTGDPSLGVSGVGRSVVTLSDYSFTDKNSTFYIERLYGIDDGKILLINYKNEQMAFGSNSYRYKDGKLVVSKSMLDVLIKKGDSKESEGTGKSVSSKGFDLLKNHETSISTLKAWGIGIFKGNTLEGIYPHYVFKNIGTTSNPVWVSDGGITFGFGHYVSQNEYNTDVNEKALVDKYAKGATLLPTNTPANGVSYAVPNSTWMSMADVEKLLGDDIKVHEKELNAVLNNYGYQATQEQFDALVNLRYHKYRLGAEIDNLLSEGSHDQILWETAIKNLIGSNGDLNRANDLVNLFNNGIY